ncbi:MAG: translocation/assembly module TamB domain-containing protein, partial [Bacteroidales bacterium]|nr:translocation/assembly module TamB domain-containing protein [Bacteroidales bacterium]
MKLFSKILRILRNILLIFIALLISLYFVFRLPMVQTRISQAAANYLSKELGTDISLTGIDISWFLQVTIENLEVNDQHNQPLLKAGKIKAGYQSFSRKNGSIVLRDVALSDFLFAIRMYSGEHDLNLQFLIDYFASTDDTTSSEPMAFMITEVELRNGRFIYDIEDKTRVESGMDYNHLDLDSIFAEIENFRLDSNMYFAKIQHLSANEISGFKLTDFKADIKTGSNGSTLNNLELSTDTSFVKMNLALEYSRWPNWLDFIDSVSLNAQIDSINLSLNDLVPFSTSLANSNIRVAANGEVKGPVSNLKLRNFSFSSNQNTRFFGRANISGLPSIEKTFFDVKMNEFVTNTVDIESVILPGGERIDLPDNLRSLQTMSIKGRFTGFYNDFVSNATFQTGLGNITTDILIKPLNTSKKIAYNGSMKLFNFNIGALISVPNIDQLTLNGVFDGQGIDMDAAAIVDVKIPNIRIGGFTYKNSVIEGKLANRIVNGFVSSADSSFSLTIDGYYNFADTLPVYRFSANVQNARINRLMLSHSDSLGVISGKIAVDALGNNADNLQGQIKIDSLYYYLKNRTYVGDSVLVMATGSNDNRSLVLNSKYVDGLIEGQFRFADLDKIYYYLMENFLPATFNNESAEAKLSSIKNLDFVYDFNFKNTSDLFSIFYPDIYLANQSKLNGFFDAEKDSLSLDFISEKIVYQSASLDNFSLKLANKRDTFQIETSANKFYLSKGFFYDSLVFNPMIYRDSIQVLLSLGKENNTSNKIFANFGLRVDGLDDIKASFHDLSLWVNDTNWVVDQTNSFHYGNHFLKVDDFYLQSGLNSLTINGLISDNPDDKLYIDFMNFDLSFFNFYLNQYFVDFKGKLSGKLAVWDLWKNLNYSAEFGIDGFMFNNTLLGQAKISSFWNELRNGIAINMATELRGISGNKDLVEISGYLFPEKEEDNLDLRVYLDDFPVESMQPFLSSFASEIKGTASGKLNVSGTFAKPLLAGKLKTNIPKLVVDYTKTTYAFQDEIEFTHNYLGITDGKVKDLQYKSGEEHSGKLNFKLFHESFQNMRLDFKVEPNRMDLLNTTKLDNELFYGNAVGTGSFAITGPLNDLYFNIDIKPLKGSKIAIPMSETASVENSEFITFIIRDSSSLALDEEEEDDFAITMDMRFDMTPEATVQLVMDETVGDIITANGEGIIRINVDKQFNVNMYGSYTIDKGDYLFTMQNIINKRFVLDKGGTITWEGDLLDARVDLSAIYRTEAKLYDLLQMIDTSDIYKRRSKVDCIINIGGSLAAPDVSFGINLPDETVETQEKVNMILYTSSGSSNMDIMNKNFISLLMLGKFQAPSGFSQGVNPNALASNATEMLASQMSNWLNKMSDDIDIGLTWNPGDEATSQEIAVALTYQAFNDRLLIDGKFGTGGESKTGESETRIVGDLNLEYAITKDKNLRARVFNRTNYDDPLTRKAPYTQG